MGIDVMFLLWQSNDVSSKQLLSFLLLIQEFYYRLLLLLISELEMINSNQIICRYYIQGRCKFGKNCKFSHNCVQCYLMRHAESTYNQALEQFDYEAFSIQAKQGYQTDKLYIDCILSEKGLSQIDNLRFPVQFQNQKIKFDLIFVSPLERCLRTAQRTILKHKIKYRKIIVLPVLTEVVSKICDLSKSISDKKVRYPNFDFSFFEGKQFNLQQWQDSLIDPQMRSKIDVKATNAERYLKILDEIFPQPLESSQRCFQRALQAVNELKRISQTQKAEKIFVVSHNRIVKYIMGRFRQGKYLSIENCQIKQTLI